MGSAIRLLEEPALEDELLRLFLSVPCAGGLPCEVDIP
jgi:hypothetical protein